jgi:predicted nuclease of predicted toxin-antitoxin system
MQFLADMGVSMRVVNWLRQQGHDASHLREQGLHRLPDSDIFTKALNEQRLLLTYDLDFAEMVALSGRQATGECNRVSPLEYAQCARH